METLLRLLHDCDGYLRSQHVLLDRAALSDCEAAAMNAALDQLDKAVRTAWLHTLTEMVDRSCYELPDAEDQRSDEAVIDPNHRADPGE